MAPINIHDSAALPIINGTTPPWFILQQKFNPPPIDQTVGDQAQNVILGTLYGLHLATLVDPNLKQTLIATRNNFDPQSTEALLVAWDIDPSLVPPGVDAKYVKQQLADCGVLNQVTSATDRAIQGLSNTQLIREAMVAQVTKEGIDFAAQKVQAEVESGGQSTLAMKATAILDQRLAERVKEAANKQKGKQKVANLSAQGLAQVTASHDAVLKQSEAQQRRIDQLEQLIAQSGLGIPPISTDATSNTATVPGTTKRPAAHKAHGTSPSHLGHPAGTTVPAGRGGTRKGVGRQNGKR